MIISQSSPVAEYIANKYKKCQVKRKKLKLNVKYSQRGIEIENLTKELGRNLANLCSNCHRRYPPNHFIHGWKNEEEIKYYCGDCIYESLDDKGKAMMVLDPEIADYFSPIDIGEIDKKEYGCIISVNKTTLQKQFYSSMHTHKAVDSENYLSEALPAVNRQSKRLFYKTLTNYDPTAETFF